jgi:hypothetical protein
MRMIVEQLVEWRLAGETEVLGEHLPQHHFVHHKIPHYQTRVRIPDRRGGKPATNRLSYVAAQILHVLGVIFCPVLPVILYSRERRRKDPRWISD